MSRLSIQSKEPSGDITDSSMYLDSEDSNQLSEYTVIKLSFTALTSFFFTNFK